MLNPAFAQSSEELPRVTGAVALVDARIVQAPGRVIERGTVVIRDGLITAVGTDVDVPYDAERIAADSLTVYAGFIDGLSHAGMPEPSKDGGERREEVEDPGNPPESLAGIQPQRKAAELLDPSDDRIGELRHVGFTTAHIVPRGDMLPGTGSVVYLTGGKRNEMVVRAEQGLVMQFAPAPGMYPSTEMGVLARFRQLYREAERRKGARETYRDGPEGKARPAYDPVHEALSPVVSGEQRVFFHTEDALEIHRALDLRQDTGAPMVLTGLEESYETVDALKAADIPLFLTLDLPDEPEQRSDSTASEPEAEDSTASYDPGFHTRSYREVHDEVANLRARRALARGRHLGTARYLERAEISFGFTTRGVEPGTIRRHLRTMVQHGLSEDRALAALTTYPAEVLGLSRRLGTVEVGKMGNLVVTSGPLFEKGTDVRYVFVDGWKFHYEPGEEDDTTSTGSDVHRDTTDASVFARQGERRMVEETGSVLVRNGTVLTITNGRLADTDVLVQDGKITDIGTDLDAPSGVKVIDASNRFVMPGIVDAHSHIAIDDINEATNQVTSEVRVGDVLDPYDIDLYRALAGGVTVSHLMHGSANVIGGQNETVKHRYGRTDPEALKMDGAPRTIKFALGENPIRLHGERNGMQPLSRMGVEFVIREALNEAQRYDEKWEAYRKARRAGEDVVAPRYDERLEVIAAILEGIIQIHCHSYRADEILMLMEVLRDFGVKNVTFQHVNEGFKIAPELAAFGAGASVFSDWWAYKFEVYYSTAYNAAILTENGVLTSINSDSPELNRHLYHEAAKSQRYGDLSDSEALSLITINPARQLGIEDRVGSIEVGKDGDLAIFDKHPLSIYAICRKTIVDGVVRFDAASDPDDMRLKVEPEAPIRRPTLRKAGRRIRCLRGSGVDLYSFMRRALHHGDSTDR